MPISTLQEVLEGSHVRHRRERIKPHAQDQPQNVRQRHRPGRHRPRARPRPRPTLPRLAGRQQLALAPGDRQHGLQPGRGDRRVRPRDQRVAPAAAVRLRVEHRGHARPHLQQGPHPLPHGAPRLPRQAREQRPHPARQGRLRARLLGRRHGAGGLGTRAREVELRQRSALHRQELVGHQPRQAAPQRADAAPPHQPLRRLHPLRGQLQQLGVVGHHAARGVVELVGHYRLAGAA